MKIKISTNKNHASFSALCSKNDLASVSAAIEAGLDLKNIWTHDVYPLELAVRYNYVELAKLLAEKGMPLHLNTVSWYKNSETEEEFHGNFIFGIIEEDASNLDVCIALLDFVNDVNTSVSRSNPLTCAANIQEKFVGRNFDNYVKRLLALGADVDWPDEIGGTQLHYIALGKNIVHVPMLIALSEDLDNSGDHGKGDITPLYRAAKKGRLVAIEAFVAAGANLNFYSDSTEQSVLDRLIEYKDKNQLENQNGEIDKAIANLRALGAKTYQELK